MNSLLSFWFSIWLYVIAAIAVVVGISLFRNWRRWTVWNKTGAVMLVVLVLHIWEENVFPGGFGFMYNYMRDSDAVYHYPLNRLSDNVTNVSAVLIYTIVLYTFGFRRVTSIATVFFCVVEIAAHLYSTVVSFQLFSPMGKTLFYSPGVVTSTLGFLPLAVVMVYRLVKDGASVRQWLSGLAISIGFLLAVVVIPPALFTDHNSPYNFPDRGYYQFVN